MPGRKRKKPRKPEKREAPESARSTKAALRGGVGAGLSEPPIRSHDFFLVVHLLQPSTHRSPDGGGHGPLTYSGVGRKVEEGVRAAATGLVAYCEQVLGSLTPPDARSSRSLLLGEGLYCPATYALWGELDLATVYLSDSPVTARHSGSLAEVGDSVNVCVAPAAPSPDLPDFNDRFRRTLASGPSAAPRPAEHRFLIVLQLRISQLLIYAESSDPTPRLETAIEQLWRETAEWSTEVERAHRYAPAVSIGLSFGWNEVLIVAMAHHPAILANLSGRLRRAPNDGGDSHLCLATFTIFGFDLAILEEAIAECGQVRDATGGFANASLSHPKLGDPPHDRASVDDHNASVFRALLAGARSRADGFPDPKNAKPVADLTSLTMQLQVNPGHEPVLVDILRSAAVDPMIALGSSEPYLAGSIDLIGPVVGVGLERANGPVVAAALVAMLNRFLVDTPRYGFASVLDASTRLGVQPGTQLGSILRGHAEYHPRELLLGKGETDPLTDLANRLHDRLRVLALPYGLAEHVVRGALGNVAWAWNSYLWWEDAIELMPPLLGLESYSTWLCRLLASTTEAGTTKVGKEAATFVIRECRRTLEADAFKILQAMRNVFQGQLWGSYSMAAVANLNPRHRGAIKTVLTVCNMIASRLLTRLLGPRATIVTIGDQTSPGISYRAGVVMIDLPANVADSPLHLDSLGHEIGAFFLRETLRFDEWGSEHRRWHSRDSTRHETLRHRLDNIGLAAFGDDPLQSRSFELWVSAFLEQELLTGPEQFDEWLRSRAARALLVTPSDSPELGLDGAYLAPNIDACLSFCRVHLYVLWARELLKLGKPSGDGNAEWGAWHARFVDRARAKGLGFRDDLKSACLYSPTDRLERQLEDEPWRRFVEDCLEAAYWLHLPGQALATLSMADYLRTRAQEVRDDPECATVLQILGRLRHTYLRSFERAVLARRVSATKVVGIRLPNRAGEPSVIVSERGRITAIPGERGPSDAPPLAVAIGEFFAAMMCLVPAWRRELLGTIIKEERRAASTDSPRSGEDAPGSEDAV